MADMTGRVVLVTGATNGIGAVTARKLAGMGATTILVGRNEGKTRRVAADIRQFTSNPNVDSITADLATLAGMRCVAEQFLARYDRLHVLVNNAGMLFTDFQQTEDGYERTFALNHLSYFLLTNLLLDTIKASGTPDRYARIVNVSSGAHRMGIDLENLNAEKGYSGLRAYGQSKMANVMFTYELARRLAKQGAYVTANVLHPGAVATGFGHNNGGFWGRLTSVGLTLLKPFMQTPEQGAETSIYLASSAQVEGVSGLYFEHSKPVKSHPASMNESDWSRLWAISEALTGIGAHRKADEFSGQVA